VGSDDSSGIFCRRPELMATSGADNTDQELDPSRRKFLIAATSAVGGVGAVLTATPFVASWAPSERARALGAPTEVDVSKLEPGQMAVVSWRKQQIYVVHRTPAMVERVKKVPPGELKDPTSTSSDQPDYAKNEIRARKAEFLVLVGICTHLGCLPKARFEPNQPELMADWPGGFFCPCHGSKFDLAGRVFQGSPASLNLRVPPYSYSNDTTLVIGLDDAAKQGVA
jgi:ubiquinol-cytochrome c reductase iron-sulfur subunit